MNKPRLDELHDISNFAGSTLSALAHRIEHSIQDTQQIYRETELDEVWRWVDVDIGEARHLRAPAHEMDRLQSIKMEVMAIHDLVGVEANLTDAARRLRQLATSLTSHHASEHGR